MGRSAPLRRWPLTLVLLNLAAASPAAATPDAAEVAILRGWDEEWSVGFGVSVAIDGDLAVVGAATQSSIEGNTGAVYVFRRVAEHVWDDEAKLTASDGGYYSFFGASVATDGERIVVSAPGEYYRHPVGTVYVYRREAQGWVEEAKLRHPESPAAYSNFGSALAISGDRLIVGSRWESRGAKYYAGGAYIYRLQQGAWVLEAKLIASDAVDGAEFGGAVALHQNLAVVGAGLDRQGNGAAYIFRSAAGVWAEEQKLLPSQLTPYNFGEAVAITSNAVVIGAFGGIDHKGRAYVFREEAGAWDETAQLTSPGPERATYYGLTVSGSGDQLIISAGWDDLDAGLGAVYFYRDGPSGWGDPLRVTGMDHFGFQVGLGRGFAIVGAAHEAYVYQFPPLAAAVDIKPGNLNNTVNPLGQGLVRVALLGSEEFDVEEVDVDSLRFGPAGASPVHRASGHGKDVNGDDRDDLVFHYRTPETGIALGDEEACVTGELLDGTPFEGCDTIRTVGPGACGLGLELIMIVPLLVTLHRTGTRFGSSRGPGGLGACPKGP